MVKRAGHGRAVERVERIAAQADGSRGLRAGILDLIRPLVPFDAFAFIATDPDTEVGGDPLADVPGGPGSLPALIRAKYLAGTNRWTSLDGPVACLAESPVEVADDSGVWRDHLAHHHVTDVASMVFRDRFGCWAFLDLWRRDGTFTPDETALLAALAPPVTAGLRSAVAVTFDARAPTRHGPAVLVLSPDLEVRGQTAETDAYLRALLPAPGDRPPVPAAAYNVAAQLLAREAGVDDHPAAARVAMPDGPWLSFRAARMEGAGDIAVTIEVCTPTERLAVLARACGLTPKETELLEHLAGGADTRALAEAMYVSRHTVQDHLKSIFAKTGAGSRRALVAKIVGA